MIVCSILLAASPIYAESETEAVSIMDTASVIESTLDSETQNESELSTAELSMQETEAISVLPEVWQETYTYLSDTQENHAFPEMVQRNGKLYQLKDTQYHITELKKEYSKSSQDLWAYAEYSPEQEIEVDGLHYTLVDTSKEEWVKNGRTKSVTREVTYLEGQEVPENLDIETWDDVAGETVYGNIPRTDLKNDGADWWEGGLEQWINYRWDSNENLWKCDVGEESFAASEESPWFENCENKLLEKQNLDGTFNQITGVAWDSEGWQDDTGGWWRTAKATGNRMIKRYRATFSGDVAENDLPMVRYTNCYMSDVTGYLITANVTYEEQIETAKNDEQNVAVSETTSEETTAESSVTLSNSDRSKDTFAPTVWDIAIMALETIAVGMGIAMISLLVRFRPKPRAWLAIPKKESKEKGE